MGEVEIDKTEKCITIYSDIFLYGDLATEFLAKEFTEEINYLWNEPDAIIEIGDSFFKVQFKMNHYLRHVRGHCIGNKCRLSIEQLSYVVIC